HRFRPRPRDAELDTTGEPAGHMSLQRMVGGLALEGRERDVAVTRVGPEEVIAQNPAGRRVLVLRQESRAVGNLIDVVLLTEVPAEAADIRRVDDRAESDVALDSEARVVGSGRFVLAVQRLIDVARPLEVSHLQERRGIAVKLLRVVDHRRIARRVSENPRSIAWIEVFSETAAHRRFVIAGHIPRKTQPGRRQNPLEIDEAYWVPRSARPDNSIE